MCVSFVVVQGIERTVPDCVSFLVRLAGEAAWTVYIWVLPPNYARVRGVRLRAIPKRTPHFVAGLATHEGIG